jgi:hypothetical protein
MMGVKKRHVRGGIKIVFGPKYRPLFFYIRIHERKHLLSMQRYLHIRMKDIFGSLVAPPPPSGKHA